jgi:hypothetical protein
MNAAQITWTYNKGRIQKTAAICFAMALVFGVFSFTHWFGLVLAALAAAVGIYTLIVGRGRKPVLSIGPEGLHYTRFSSRAVPWSEIMEVAVIRGAQRGVSWGKVYYKPSPSMDEIAFSLKSYDAYSGPLRNALRGVHTIFGVPGVRCNVWHLDGASVDDIARAIHAHWPGTIQDKVARDGRFETTAWTGTPPPIA